MDDENDRPKNALHPIQWVMFGVFTLGIIISIAEAVESCVPAMR